MVYFRVSLYKRVNSIDSLMGRCLQLYNGESPKLCCRFFHFNSHNNLLTHEDHDKFQRKPFSNPQQGFSHQEIAQQPDQQPLTKLLKIAIIGTPNTGKSTFINQIIGRKVLAISKKVHTTRARARGVINLHDTQVVFLDTPGLVSQTESEKFQLESAFIRDGEMAMVDAHIIGVMHDVGNVHTRGKLDRKVLRLLNLYPWKHSVLILNKVDMVAKKHYLLDLADRLTAKSLRDEVSLKEDNFKKLTEEEVMKEVKRQSGWPYFQQVFMVSALEGEGVGEVMEYFLQYAKPGKWLFQDHELVTDQKPERVICESVKAKLLDHLPNETPYKCRVNMEMFKELRDGTIMSVVKVTCPNTRVERMAKRRIRLVAQEAEEEMRSAFLTQVLIRIALETTG